MAAITAVLGGSVTLVKSAYLWHADHSIDRRLKHAVDDISTALTRIHELEAMSISGPEIQLYREHLQEDLLAATKWLESARERKRIASVKKATESVGWRRQLLLYRPSGFSGWLIHTMFYCMVAFSIAIVFESLKEIRSSPDDAWYAFIAAPFVLLALYFRSVSHRMQHNAFSGATPGKAALNSDINWFRRLFLFFRPRGFGAYFVHFCFYMALLYAVIFICMGASGDVEEGFDIMGLISFLFALVFHADALARRQVYRMKSAAMQSTAVLSAAPTE